jgi:Txe/YoeB family toxin of toxin-antitoxin system
MLTIIYYQYNIEVIMLNYSDKKIFKLTVCASILISIPFYPFAIRATALSLSEEVSSSQPDISFKEIYSGLYLNNMSADEIANAIKSGIAAKIQKVNLAEAENNFKRAAMHGDATGMYWLGLIHEEKGDILQAVKWYIQGFQENWLLSQRHHPLIKGRLDKLLQPENVFSPNDQIDNFLKHYKDTSLQGFLEFYPTSKANLLPALRRLSDIYKTTKHEPYLSAEESNIKSHRFNQLAYIVRNGLTLYSPDMWLGLGCLYEEGTLGDPIDGHKASRCYERANHPDAWSRLAAMWEDGRINGVPNYKKAEEYYIKSNSPDGWFNLGLFYISGRGNKGEPEYLKAVEAYKKAKTPEAWVKLGLLFEAGKVHGKPDYIEAKNCYEKAKTSEAWHNLGLLYDEGKIGKKPDYVKAEMCYLRANHPTGNYNLGLLYQNGKIGGRPQYLKAKAAFEKSKLPEAWVCLGQLYEEGKITPKPDYKEAERCFLKAGTPNAWLGIASLHLEGKLNGKPDSLQAQKYFLKSNTPTALYNLGLMYLQGKIGGKPNYRKAEQYFLASNLPLSLYNVGVMHERGFLSGMPNLQQAKKYYEKANECNSLCNLGGLHAHGKFGTPPDYREAEKCFRKSNTPEGWHNLGVLHAKGELEASPNYKEAQRCFEKSKTPDSWLALGMLYEQGKMNDSPDPQRAKTYYQKADTVLSLQLLLNLYTEGLIQNPLSSAEEERITKRIQQRLNELKGAEQAYQTGHIAYLKNQLEEAFGYYSQALFQGMKEAKWHCEHIASLIYMENMLLLLKSLEETEQTDESGIALTAPEEVESKDALQPLLPSSQLAVEPSSLPETEERQPMLVTIETSVASVSTVSDKDKEPIEEINTQILNAEQNKMAKIKRFKAKLQQKSQKIKNSFLRLRNITPDTASQQDTSKKIEFTFKDENVKSQFFNILNHDNHSQHNKLKRLCEDIRQQPWSLKGEGQPEILKGKYNGYKGCISRRIDAANRLIYRIEAGIVLILSCEGHYD